MLQQGQIESVSKRGLAKHMTQSHTPPRTESEEPVTMITDDQKKRLDDIFAVTGDPSGNEFMQWFRGGWEGLASIDAENLIMNFDDHFAQFQAEVNAG